MTIIPWEMYDSLDLDDDGYVKRSMQGHYVTKKGFNELKEKATEMFEDEYFKEEGKKKIVFKFYRNNDIEDDVVSNVEVIINENLDEKYNEKYNEKYFIDYVD